MKIDYKELEGCKRQLDIEIPGDIVNKEMSRASDEMARHVRVPGFRPGKVPRSVVRQRYKTELRQETLRNLLPSAIETAVEQHRLRIIGEPAVEKLDFADDGALSFTVGIEVLPVFEARDHNGLAITKRVYKVTDEDVEKVLTAMREEAAELVADDTEGREVKDGDFVSLDLEGAYVEAEGEKHAHAHAPLKLDDVSIEIGAVGVLDEFNSHIRGMKVGEQRSFQVAYPKEFPNPALAGHTIDYSARLAAVRNKEVPELDDAFASDYSEGKFETVDALRASVRENLEKRAEGRTTQELNETVIDKLLEGNEFAVPETLVDQQARQRMDNLIRSFSGRGMDPREMDLDWTALFEGAKKAAERDVRAAFVIDGIAKKESVTATDEDVDDEIRQIAASVEQDEAQVRARLTKEGGADTIRDRVRHRKVLDLVAQAAQTTVEEIEGVDAGTDEPEGEKPETNGADAAGSNE